MKDTLAFGLLTLVGGLIGALAGHFMPDEQLTIACYAVGIVAVPFLGMRWLHARKKSDDFSESRCDSPS